MRATPRACCWTRPSPQGCLLVERARERAAGDTECRLLAAERTREGAAGDAECLLLERARERAAGDVEGELQEVADSSSASSSFCAEELLPLLLRLCSQSSVTAGSLSQVRISSNSTRPPTCTSSLHKRATRERRAAPKRESQTLLLHVRRVSRSHSNRRSGGDGSFGGQCYTLCTCML